MGALTQSDGATRGWQFVQAPAFAQNNAYPKPVLALAQNHVHFLGTGTAGSVEIFVIHFSYMQPDPQVFSPIEDGGSAAPSTTGQTASIFKGPEAVQTKFAFVPDDGASTFVFDVIVSKLLIRLLAAHSVHSRTLLRRSKAHRTSRRS